MSDASDAPEDRTWVEMEVRGLVVDPVSEVPILILRESRGPLFLPIWIGVFEANAIALALSGTKTPRPMTHDLLASSLATLEARLRRVEVTDLVDGTFIARLRVERAGGSYEIDSRPSDAIALALRVPVPIFVARAVLDKAMTSRLATTETPDEDRIKDWLENVRPEDLGKYQM